jgi:hypothetical protein
MVMKSTLIIMIAIGPLDFDYGELRRKFFCLRMCLIPLFVMATKYTTTITPRVRART